MLAEHFDTKEHISDKQLQMYGSLNTKIPKAAADWCSVTETLYIRTAGLK